MSAPAAIFDLARGMQQQRVNIASQPARRDAPHSCGVDRHDDIWRAGYVAGLAAAIAIETGEDSVTVEARIEAEIGCPIEAAVKAPTGC